MLTREGYHERRWGPFPALRQILEHKKIHDPLADIRTSVDDTPHEQLGRLLDFCALVEQNAAEISAALSAERHARRYSAGPPPLHQDLEHLAVDFRWARSIFDEALGHLDQIRRRAGS